MNSVRTKHDTFCLSPVEKGVFSDSRDKIYIFVVIILSPKDGAKMGILQILKGFATLWGK